jgi:glycosyltransferase involved in cell wall biosynthesis
MKILIVHNVYQQRAGEEAVVSAESRLLRDHGHQVLSYERCNDELHMLNGLAIAAGTIWSLRSFRELTDLIGQERPHIAHFHNTFPLVSPSAYYACARAGVAVVQTLHNYRLLCPEAKFLRQGKICQACLGRNVAWPAVVHGCYRGSRPATAAAAAMLAVHREAGTWQTKVDAYVALSEFARQKFIEGGLPADRIMVKPNFVASDPGARAQPGDYALFVGRLSDDKGPQLMLSAWRALKTRIPLRIAGDGPLLEKLSREVRETSSTHIELLGRRNPDEVRALMQRARFLVFPSLWYEGFPMTIAEAFAGGLPVVASRLGSMAEIVQGGGTGLHFEPGNALDLAAKVEWAWTHPEELVRMGHAARAEYEARYQPSTNYKILMEIYRSARSRREQKGAAKLTRVATSAS